jgi:hypothetical protein
VCYVGDSECVVRWIYIDSIQAFTLSAGFRSELWDGVFYDVVLYDFPRVLPTTDPWRLGNSFARSALVLLGEDREAVMCIGCYVGSFVDQDNVRTDTANGTAILQVGGEDNYSYPLSFGPLGQADTIEEIIERDGFIVDPGNNYLGNFLKFDSLYLLNQYPPKVFAMHGNLYDPDMPPNRVVWFPPRLSAVGGFAVDDTLTPLEFIGKV